MPNLDTIADKDNAAEHASASEPLHDAILLSPNSDVPPSAMSNDADIPHTPSTSGETTGTQPDAQLVDPVVRDGVARALDVPPEDMVDIPADQNEDDQDDDDDDMEEVAEDGKSGKKKPGKKGDFKGKRLKYLKDAQEEYFKASANGKAGVSAWYTNTFFPGYFKTFHWAIPWTSDSVKDPSKLPPDDDEKLTDEQRREKATRSKALKKKIKTWFNTNRNTVRTTSGSHQAWNPWLRKLKEGCRVKPRKPQASQFYMHHSDFKSKVDAEYDRQCKISKKDNNFRMSTRYGIAKDLLSKEGTDVKERINRELEESHARALAEYESGVWVSDTPEDRGDALDSMTSVIQPLLDGIHQITGFHVGFFAAGAREVNGQKGSKYDCLSLTAGVCQGTKKPLEDVDPQLFGQLIRTFTKIVASASKTPSDAETSGPPNREQSESVPSTPRRYVATPDPHLQRASGSDRTHQAAPQPTKGLPPNRPTPPPQSLPSSRSTSRSEPTEPLTTEAIIQNAMNEVRKTLAEGGHSNANEDLLRSIVNLKGQKKATRIAELLAMAEYEFDRENNIAKNRVLLAQIGIDGDLESLLSGLQARDRLDSPPRGDDADYVASDSAARKAVNTITSPRKTRSSTSSKPASTAAVRPSSKRSRDMIDESPESPIPPSAAPSSMRGKPSSSRKHAAPTATTAAKPSSSRKQAAPTTAAGQRPDWFEIAWATLYTDEKSNLYGPTWMKVLEYWEELEKDEGYEENGMLLSTSNRPKEVRLWIKSARPYHRIPSFNAVTYGKTWWRWWIANNPAWRKKTTDGQYLVCGDSGDWGDHLPATGLNGFLSIVAGLWFWRENASDACPSLAAWNMALSDVEWVLSQLVAEAREEEDASQAVEPPHKRVHREP